MQCRTPTLVYVYSGTTLGALLPDAPCQYRSTSKGLTSVAGRAAFYLLFLP